MLKKNLLKIFIILLKCKNTLNTQENSILENKNLFKKRKHIFDSQKISNDFVYRKTRRFEKNKEEIALEEYERQNPKRETGELMDISTISVEELLKESEDGISNENLKEEYIKIFDESLLFEKNKKENIFEEEKMRKTKQETDELMDISTISVEELLKEPEDGISNENLKEEYIKIFDESFLSWDENQKNKQMVPTIMNKNVNNRMEIENKEIMKCQKKELMKQNNETVYKLDRNRRSTSQLNNPIQSNIKNLTLLSQMIAKFQQNNTNDRDEVNFKICMLPEILGIFYFKIKNGGSEDELEALYHKLFKELSEEAFSPLKSKKTMFEKQIKARTRLMVFLMTDETCPNSHIGIYMRLLEVLELKLIKSSNKHEYYVQMNIISSLFMIIFLLENDEIKILEANVSKIQNFAVKEVVSFRLIEVIFNKLNIKNFILMMFEIRKVVTSFNPIKQCFEALQFNREYKSYFNEFKQRLRTDTNNELKEMEIFTFLQAIEEYKYAFKGFCFKI